MDPSGVCRTSPAWDSILELSPRATATSSASVSERAPRSTPPIEPMPRMAICIMPPPKNEPRSAG